MRRADVESTHHERPAGVALLFQLAENPVDSSIADARNILKRKPARSDFADEADRFEVETGSHPLDPAPFGVGCAGVLAGGASGHNIDWPNSIVLELPGGELLHIVINSDAGEVSGVLPPSPLIDFTCRDSAQASSVKAEAPSAACATEEVEDSHVTLSPPSVSP